MARPLPATLGLHGMKQTLPGEMALSLDPSSAGRGSTGISGMIRWIRRDDFEA